MPCRPHCTRSRKHQIIQLSIAIMHPPNKVFPMDFPHRSAGPFPGTYSQDRIQFHHPVRHRGHGWSKRFLVTHLALERVTWATRAPTAHFPRQFCASAGHVRWGQCPKTAQVRGCPASYPGAPTTEGPFAQMSRAPTS